MAKSRDAFRTISEVADWLDTPAHVLRFWESKFSQVKPVKRAGGRRYYRPADMELLGGIKKLLHDEGMTIKGVQKILREQGIKHVSGLSEPAEEEDVVADAPYIDAPEELETVVPFAIPDRTLDETQAETFENDVEDQMPAAEAPPADIEPLEDENIVKVTEEEAEEVAASEIPAPTETTEPPNVAPQSPVTNEPEVVEEIEDVAPQVPKNVPNEVLEDEAEIAADLSEETPEEAAVEDSFAEDTEQSPMPGFIKEPLATEDKPKPAQPIPDDPDLSTIEVNPGALSAVGKLSHLSEEDAAAIEPVIARLRSLQERLIAPRR